MEAKVVAIGAGKIEKAGKRIPLAVKVGDKVLIGKYWARKSPSTMSSTSFSKKTTSWESFG